MRRALLPVVVAFLVLAVVQLALVTLNSGSHYDEAVYRGVARNIERYGMPLRDSSPREVFTNSPPIGMYLAALLRSCSGDVLTITRTLSIALLGGTLIFLLSRIVREHLAPTSLATTVMCLVAIPLFTAELVPVEVDMPLTVASTAVLLLWLRWRDDEAGRRSWRGALALGAALGVAGLTKYAGMLPAVLIAGERLWAARRGGPAWARALLEIVVVALPPVALLLLWWWAAGSAMGVDLLDTFRSLGERATTGSDATWDAGVGLATFAVWAAADLNAVVVLLALAGAWLEWRGADSPARRRAILILVAFVLLRIAVVVNFPAETRRVRYLDPILPVTALFAASALTRWQADRRTTWTFAVAAGVGSLALVGPWQPRLEVAGIGVPIAAPVAGLGLVVAAVLSRRLRDGLGDPRLHGLTLGVAFALALARSPVVARVSWSATPAPTDDVIALVQQHVPEDGVVGASDPPTAYPVDRMTRLLRADDRLHRRLQGGPYPALVVTAGWRAFVGQHPEAAAELGRRYTLALETEDGIAVYVPRE